MEFEYAMVFKTWDIILISLILSPFVTIHTFLWSDKLIRVNDQYLYFPTTLQ